jgi:hypothetical protein
LDYEGAALILKSSLCRHFWHHGLSGCVAVVTEARAKGLAQSKTQGAASD